MSQGDPVVLAHYPAWRYGPGGATRIIQSAAEEAPGWGDRSARAPELAPGPAVVLPPGSSTGTGSAPAAPGPSAPRPKTRQKGVV